MPLQKLAFKAGVNREKTRYASEGSWYESDKVRFRQGFPEKIGGWQRISDNTFEGVCRSLFSWSSLSGGAFTGVGTNEKFYIEQGGVYNDVTPFRDETSAGDATFSATDGSTTITVTENGHGAAVGDYVTFSGATSLGGNVTAAVLNTNHEITVVTDANTFEIEVATAADASDTADGGTAAIAKYEVPIGTTYAVPLSGWGGGEWGEDVWGTGGASLSTLRLWSQSNFGEDLILGYRGSEPFYWDASSGLTTKAVKLSTLAGASDTPTSQNQVLVSDVSRFVFCFGANPLGSSTQDTMLIRWSDQEDAANWTPAATNQAGSLRLSSGSEIIAARQGRQEILVWTNSALYSLQYQGAPIVWGAQVLGENISIASPNSMAFAANTAFWMGHDNFYVYDGRVRPLPCDVRRYIFNDFNFDQYDQVFAGSNEAFSEIWWFYCAEGSNSNDRYVVYNYVDNIWYYGNLDRSAWLESGQRDKPIAATYGYKIVQHEVGVDNAENSTPAAIPASITTAQFDVGDGDKFSFVYQLVPDVTFDGSTASTPAATVTLTPANNSGSGYNSPASVGGNSSGSVVRSAVAPIEEFTEELGIRVRGRQLSFKIESTELGVTWQLGIPRIHTRLDGQR